MAELPNFTDNTARRKMDRYRREAALERRIEALERELTHERNRHELLLSELDRILPGIEDKLDWLAELVGARP